MVTFYDDIPEFLFEWIPTQKVFWVATAPRYGEHVNVSPKGHAQECFAVIDSKTVWYQDLTGSGSETIAHVKESKFVVDYLVVFDLEVRLWGKAKVHEIGSAEYESFLPQDKRIAGSRSVIVIDVKKVATSCGYAVPYFDYVGDREVLKNWAEKNDDLPGYRLKKNFTSIDGLPAFRSAGIQVGMAWANKLRVNFDWVSFAGGLAIGAAGAVASMHFLRR
ncbi:hypothetical protein SmJEL517_g06153 [Synchytrium microbalum]|uniref:Pyridoxamine 5'-phosphate oxidase N-terminal domain-containing protein n=1 Tax=Synchytrium microbalum TaxID=1806994 RepID=A0A507BY20_9FUNG|nr:uncharacterized protein SmJEL517_g06153 [Synchytrium microbalum]TPX30235.1 hypothetical protein SmJEL517_g06153 [Synchytrium microbalum]